MYYKIVAIKDLWMHNKKDEASVNRLGRIIDMSESVIEEGERGLLVCVYPGAAKSLRTSNVMNVVEQGFRLIIYTEHSVYYLEPTII